MPPLSWRASARSPEDAFFCTERLHCMDVLRMKATTVALILESKCGPEAFLSIVRSMLQAAVASRASMEAPSAAAGAANGVPAAQGAVSQDAPPWRLNAAAFLKQVAQVGGFRREVNSFAERWVYGSGCPQIRGVFFSRCTETSCMACSLCDSYLSSGPAVCSCTLASCLDDHGNTSSQWRALIRSTCEHAVAWQG